MPANTAYQRPSPSPVAGRREPEPFDEGLPFIARRLRLSVPGLDDYERELLTNFGRGASVDGEVRYRMVTLRALLAIASCSTKLEDREALPELFRAEILAKDPCRAGSVPDAFDLETSVTGPANEAQRAFERNPSRSTWQVCRDALLRQAAATRRALDAVLTH